MYALPDDFEMVIPQQLSAGPDNPGNWPYERMAETIEELSGGQMRVEWTYGSALYPENETVAAVRDSLVPMSFVMPGIEPTGFDTFTWFGEALSAEVPTARPVIGELTTFAGSVEHGLTDEAAIEEYRALGVEPLLPRIVVHSGYHLLCKEPVTGLDDARGKLTRTAGPNWVSEAKAVGFESVSIPPLEQYEALQRGVVDCVMGPLRDWYALDLLDVASELTMDDQASFVGFPAGWIANPDWWESLPPGAQNIIWHGLFEWATEYGTNQPTLDMGGLRQVAEGPQTIRPMDDDLRDRLLEFQAGKREQLVAQPPAEMSSEEADAELARLGESFDTWLEYLVEEVNYDERYPEQWSRMTDVAQETERVEAPEWKERVWEEVFEPNLPNP